MKKNLYYVVALILATAPVTYAQGLLGERYIGASYDHGSAEEIDTWGVTLHYNNPLFEDREYAYDLNVRANYVELDEADFQADGKQVEAGIVIYPIKTMEMRPFLAAHAGFGEATVFGLTDDSFVYRISIGGEWQASERLTITPVVSFFDYTDIEDGDEITLGIEGNVWLTDNNSVGLGYSQTSSDGFDFEMVSLSYRFAF